MLLEVALKQVKKTQLVTVDFRKFLAQNNL